ncbi:MAG: hypothetical protein KBC64_00760 [Simkaniaceae bacterium]|nr:hypothetical protein [Simkaniaceae bacterium]
MKGTFLLASLMGLTQLSAASDTFSRDRLEAFDQVFVTEEREILANAGLTSHVPATDPVPPPNPAPPPFISPYLPFVMVNNSTLPDSSVNIVITGDQPDDHTVFVFVQFDSSGIGTLVDMTTGMNSSTYNKTLDQFPLTSSGDRVMYLPYIDSSRVWISMNSALSMPVISGNRLQEPNFTSSSDPNYYTNFDKFEFAFLSTGTPISINATAVDFFSIPLYIYVSTATSVNSNTGLYQPRSYCMAAAANVFAGVPTKSEWDKLFLESGSTTLRLLSTGKAMTASPPIFNANYLDDAATYGYSLIEAIWTGPSSFYRAHPPALTIPITGNPTYTGTVQVDNRIIFDDGNGHTVVFRAPSPPDYSPSGFTTSGQILSAEPLYTTETVAGAGVQVSKLFEEALIAGLSPTTNTLSNTYLTDHQSSYYTINPNLSSTGQSTGPWYDVYSKALHSLGQIYAFGFDEPLWPSVAVTSNYEASSTYVGVTIGSIN